MSTGMATIRGEVRKARLGLIDRYLIRGVASRFVVILAAVCVAMLLERALRLVHEMAVAGADISYFLPLLLQLLPYYLALALPAALMVALVLLVARLDDHQELEALLGAGLPMARIAAPLAGFSIAIACVALVAGGWLEPLGRYGFRQLKAEALNAGRLNRLEPRALYQPTESTVFTFDRRLGADTVGGLFLWQRQADGGKLMLTGQSGRIVSIPRGRAFEMEFRAGRMIVEQPGSRAPSLVEFGGLALREPLLLRDASWRRGGDAKEMTLDELGRALATGPPPARRHSLQAEFWSRLVRAAAIPLLPFLVLPLAFAPKKGRRTLGLLVCGALLAFFHHAVNLAKEPGVGFWSEPRTGILTVAGAAVVLVGLVFWSGRHLPSHSPISSLLRPVDEFTRRRRQREGKLTTVPSHTLSTYLSWRLGKAMLIALIGIVALFQLVDLLDRGEDFIARGWGVGEVLQFYALRLAPIVQQSLPFAALAGAAAVFSGLARNREIVAMQAAGLSPFRILAMALPAPLMLALAALVLGETVTPASQLTLAAWWKATEPKGASEQATPRWFRIGDEVVRADGVSADGTKLERVAIFRRGPDRLLDERLAAASAVDTGGWTLNDVVVARFAGGARTYTHRRGLAWPTPLTPADARAFFAQPGSITSATARRSLVQTAPVSQGPALFETRLYRSLGEPFAPLVMLLLALPLAFALPRAGIPWRALLYAGGGGLFYLAADGAFTVAAQVGYLPVPLGTLGAPLIGMLLGLTVLLYADRSTTG